MDVETYLGGKREYTQIIPETEYIALTDNNYVPLTQVQISLCAKIGYTYYCEYAHLLKKHTEHTCMSAIYYDQESKIKANQCKTIAFDNTLESKILDAGNILILSNLQKPWTIACKDISRVFEIEYSTYHILNRSDLCECLLTAGNYLLSQTDTNCRDMPEARDGYFTTYYAFNKIILDIITVKFNIQVDDRTMTQSTLLHDDIPGYNLPTLEYVLPPVNDDEDLILEEENPEIYAHLENVLVHMIDTQDIAIFKSQKDYIRNKQKFLEYIHYVQMWQVLLVIFSYVAFTCNIILVLTLIIFFIRYQKIMQAMLTAFITMNTNNTGITSTKANPISRTFPPLFTIKISKEEKIAEHLHEIESMQLIVQVIMIIICILIAFIVLYYCCKKFRHMRTLFKYCFPFLPILRILQTSRRTDLFVEVTNVTKGNTVWAHFMATGYFPINIHLSRPILKESVRIETRCCIFKRMIIDWTNTEVTGISGIRIEMPNEAKISIFTGNDLTHITDDRFEFKLVARLLDQIYVVPLPQSPPRYDDTPLDPMSFTQTVNSTGSLTASALMLPLHVLINPT